MRKKLSKKVLYIINVIAFSFTMFSANAMGLLFPSPNISISGLDKAKSLLRSVFVLEVIKIILLIAILVFAIKISCTLKKMLKK